MPRQRLARTIPPRIPERRHQLLDTLVEVILRDGFAQLSLEDIARELRCSKSTLYTISDTKERIILAGVRRFFQRAAERVEALLAQRDATALERIRIYLTGIATELAPASPAFFADLDSWPTTQQIYRDNTRFASERVRQLVREASPTTSSAQAVFVGAVAAQVMEGIHRGELEAATGLADSAAYRALADLIVRALNSPTTKGAAS